MSEVFCDILPDARGWVFLSKGGRSPSYPSYHLAVEAAKRHLGETKDERSCILRRQDLKGRMRKITGMAEFYQPPATLGVVTMR